MKQTAVEWLWDQLKENNMLTFDEWTEIVEQAKAMEKEQIMNAYNISWALRDKPYATADKYYNETFKSE